MKKFCFILVLLSLFLASCVSLQDATISTTGTVQFSDESIDVLVILVNDLKAAINNWNSVPENKAPITKSTQTVSLENNSIAPFIVYAIRNQSSYPIYYDCELVKPHNMHSKFKGEKLFLCKQQPKRGDLFYLASQNYGWSLDETDPDGEYTILIKIYTDKNIIREFRMNFTFRKS